MECSVVECSEGVFVVVVVVVVLCVGVWCGVVVVVVENAPNPSRVAHF
jgi:ABC-type transporter Mla subunit MlaD